MVALTPCKLAAVFCHPGKRDAGKKTKKNIVNYPAKQLSDIQAMLGSIFI